MKMAYADGKRFELPCEFFRVYSRSTEVHGDGARREVPQVGKKNVDITAIEPVGRYAMQARFSETHDGGLYSRDYLYELGMDQNQLWRQYLQRMRAAGANRKSGAAPAVAPQSG